jgi:serine/threonine protein kinase
MESGNRTKKSYGCLCGEWIRGLIHWVLNLKVALVRPEIESPKIKLCADASRQETSNVEKAQVGTVPRAAMEMFATTPMKTVRSAPPEPHTPSFGSAEATDRIHELEDELWEKMKCLKKGMDRLTSQLMQFNKDIQANDKIISELKKKLNVQKHEGTEDGVENIATMTNKSLNSQFDVFRLLGTGAFGTVYLVRKKGGGDDGKLYAMKVLEKDSVIQEDIANYAITERRVLEAIRHHPFVTTLHYAFQTDSKLYLVLDYIGGGNLSTNSYGRKFTEDEVRIYVSEIILALEHLHKLGIIHRDVKLENILLDLDGHAVLSDFGLSRMFLPNEDQQAYSSCGTVCYMAPEVLQTSADGYDMAVDWWSLGIVTHELLTGGSPFEIRGVSETEEELICRITEKEPYIQEDLSSDAEDFISKLLVKDPRKRLGGGKDDAEELKRHPFLKGMNWSDLAQKKIWAPFKPQKTNEFDVSNLSDDSTQTIFSDLPAALPPSCDDIFRGYSYVLPSVICSEHAVSDELYQPTVELSELSRSLNL